MTARGLVVVRARVVLGRGLASLRVARVLRRVGPGDFRRTVGADTFFYHLLPELEAATYYLEMNPGSTNAPGSRLASDVARADWLILDRSWDYINEPNRSSEFGSDVPNQIVREKFNHWAEYGPYLLMRSQRLRNLLELPPSQQ